jgi:hypothetical protein
MFRMRLFGMGIVALCSSVGCGEDGAGGMSNVAVTGVMKAGNGAPGGAHYNLNIIGVQSDKSADMTGDSGHRIFVPLSGQARIMLSEGEFAVLDANGTDGSAAFQLPSPDPDNDGETEYSVYVRALGMPGGKATIVPTATDPVTGEVYASTLSTVVLRDKGRSSFTNVSKTLLYVYADVDGDGIIDRVPLFDSRLQDYYWSYDNQGLKLAQLRFYEVPTIVD